MHATEGQKMYALIQKKTLFFQKSIQWYIFCVHWKTFWFSKKRKL